MEEMPGELHKAWLQFFEDYKQWKQSWDILHQSDAYILDHNLPGYEAAWTKFRTGFRIWQDAWRQQYPKQALIIHEFIKHNKGRPENDDPADFWKK